MFCPVLELPSVQLLAESNFRQLQFLSKQGFVDCSLALPTPPFIEVRRVLNVVPMCRLDCLDTPHLRFKQVQ